MKLEKSRKDQFRRLAKDYGYRSRSAFKLKQINKKYSILRKGDTVVDIGCAPGGWLQVSLEEVGTVGKVIGIDLKTIEPILSTYFINKDVEDKNVLEEIKKISNTNVDVVLSDIAPNVSGNWELDQARQIVLTVSILDLTKKILKKKGKAVFKLFQGDMIQDFLVELRKNFEEIILTKPVASRQESSEVYVICLKFNPLDIL